MNEAEKLIVKNVIHRMEQKRIDVVTIGVFPDCDQVDFIELEDLSSDISQGSGNVIIRYFYIPGLDIVCKFADF